MSAIKPLILVQTEEKHNKFWTVHPHPDSDSKITVRWGRLGTKGQSQTKEFANVHQTTAFVAKKSREKLGKGYKEVTQTTMDRMAIEAAIVGAQNKIYYTQYVNIIEADDTVRYEVISDNDLSNPACNPGILVHLETRTSTFTILFTPQSAYIAEADGQQLRRIDSDYPLRELINKVEEVIGYRLSS